jgi:hypothetical protein
MASLNHGNPALSTTKALTYMGTNNQAFASIVDHFQRFDPGTRGNFGLKERRG